VLPAATTALNYSLSAHALLLLLLQHYRYAAPPTTPSLSPSPLQLFRDENIECHIDSYPDNKGCVELLAARGGVLRLLNSECQQISSTDAKFLSTVHRTLAAHPFYAPPPRKADVRDAFSVRHYAGAVKYVGLPLASALALRPRPRALATTTTTATAPLLPPPLDYPLPPHVPWLASPPPDSPTPGTPSTPTGS
jgi:hypothetical protein